MHCQPGKARAWHKRLHYSLIWLCVMTRLSAYPQAHSRKAIFCLQQYTLSTHRQAQHSALLKQTKQHRKGAQSSCHKVSQPELQQIRCCCRTGAATPPRESAGRSDQASQRNTALRAAACAVALYAWCRYSAHRPASLFASASIAAGPGIRTAGRSAWAGLAAGCLHSLSGPDHLAALTPLTIGRSSVKASLLGAWWGFGHCIGQLVLGLLMLFLKDRFHNILPVLDKYSSLTIGLTLMTIGAMGLYESFAESPCEAEITQQMPPLAFESAGTAPRLAEATSEGIVSTSGASVSSSKLERRRGGFGVWTLVTGIVYGLQPDALFVVIPALALPTKLAAAAYMGMFVAGTVAAMGSYTAVIGATSRAIQSQGSWLRVERLSALASLVALLMGLTVVCGGTVTLPFLSGQ